MGVWLYNLFFVAALPVLLALWAQRVDALVSIAPPPAYIGAPLAIGGAALMLWSIAVFMLSTGRAPSNANPPDRRVIAGPYRLFSDPIYIGAALFAFGAFAWIGSGAGFWLVAPALSLGATALVFGREALMRPPLHDASRLSLLSLPDGADTSPTWRERLGAVLHGAAFIMFAEQVIIEPAAPLRLALTGIAFPLVAISLTSRWTLRRFVLGLWATGLVALTLRAGPTPSLLAPPLDYSSLLIGALVGAHLSATQLRAFIGLALALALFAASTAWSPLAWAGVALLIAPMHALLLRLTETIANSWSAFRIGPVRVINYAFYAFAGAAAGAALFLAIVGERGVLASAIITLCIVVSAALWGQLVEFSGKLARPFGYYGALIGAFIGVGLASVLLDISPWLLGAGLVFAAPAAQALGRLRCLVQGCCHGGRCAAQRGITYRRTQSRVLRIAKLGDQPLHPTPLYSIYANAIVMLLLARMLAASAPQTQLIGVYLLASGALRFIEEAYRGEPQTPVWRGLKLYQWLALAQALTGVCFTLLASAPTPSLSALKPIALTASISAGLIAGIAMGVDLPNAKRRFSQLTPTD